MHNHHNHGRSGGGGSRRSNTDLVFGIANLFNVLAGIFASYVGAQHRASLEHLKAENQALKNRIAAQNIGKAHNDVVKGDQDIEIRELKKREMQLKVMKLERELGVAADPFAATGYPDPGNIREEERRR